MPEDERIESLTAVDAGIFSVLTRLGERVTRLEAQTEAQNDSLRVIREAIHGIHNNMQVFVVAETRCSEGLIGLRGDLNEHNESLKMLTAALTSLQLIRARSEGAFWTIGKICILVGGVFTLISALVALWGWILEHHFHTGFS